MQLLYYKFKRKLCGGSATALRARIASSATRSPRPYSEATVIVIAVGLSNVSEMSHDEGNPEGYHVEGVHLFPPLVRSSRSVKATLPVDI